MGSCLYYAILPKSGGQICIALIFFSLKEERVCFFLNCN